MKSSTELADAGPYGADAGTYGFEAVDRSPLSRHECSSSSENRSPREKSACSIAIPATFIFQLGRRSNFLPKAGFLSM